MKKTFPSGSPWGLGAATCSLVHTEQLLSFRCEGPWEAPDSLFGSYVLRFHLAIINYSTNIQKFFLGGLYCACRGMMWYTETKTWSCPAEEQSRCHLLLLRTSASHLKGNTDICPRGFANSGSLASSHHFRLWYLTDAGFLLFVSWLFLYICPGGTPDIGHLSST